MSLVNTASLRDQIVYAFALQDDAMVYGPDGRWAAVVRIAWVELPEVIDAFLPHAYRSADVREVRNAIGTNFIMVYPNHYITVAHWEPGLEGETLCDDALSILRINWEGECVESLSTV